MKKALFIVVAVLAALVILIGPSRIAGASTAGPVYDASSYGARCTGTLVSTANGGSVDGDAIQKAIGAAEAGPTGATVMLPSGHCMISKSLDLQKGNGITLTGTVSSTGTLLTTVTDPINPKYQGGDFQVRNDHNTIRSVVLDQSSYGGTATVQGNYNTFQNVTALGGKTFFVLYFMSPTSGTQSVGNQLLDSTVVSLIARQVAGGPNPYDDGISWSNQDQSLIQNVKFTGTRLALYEDTNTTVNGYTYYPGPQTGGLDGFFITQPSNNVTLENLTMYGSAGVVGNDGATNGIVSNVKITNEQVMAPTAGTGFTLNGPSHGLQINNVQGLDVNQSNLDSPDVTNSSIALTPSTSAQGVVVENTTVPRVSFSGHTASGSTTPGTTDGAAFNNDTFPAYTWPTSTNVADETFVDYGGSATFQVNGGNWYNSEPEDGPNGGFVVGGGVTYTATSLGGYNAPLSAPAPA